jgi:lipoyl(octanoyl) transferase
MTIDVKKDIKLIDYLESMNTLEQRVNDVFLGKKNEMLWIIEHNHVYTAGMNSKDEELLDKNVNIVKSNRGGKYTYHGPGQKVIYFVLNLNKRGKDIRKLLNNIENCIINILAEYEIKSYRDPNNIGIWTGSNNNSKKIAAIGIKIKKWIAYHGFAINISNDLSKYKKIIPCGIKNKGVTSLKDMGVKDLKNIDEVIKNKFLDTFL